MIFNKYRQLSNANIRTLRLPTTFKHAQLSITQPDQQNICKTCGTRYSNEKYAEDMCQVCLDDRQYVKASGQEWVSFNTLMEEHSIKMKQHSEELFEITIWPSFALGQRAFFIKSDQGNILWDCIPLITEPIVSFIQQHGGVQAIAISHPHYYSLMDEWAKVFDAPVYIHQDDQQWVMDSKENILFWSGDTNPLTPKTTLINTGGHFPGSTVLHHQFRNTTPALFTGDSLYLSRDKKHLSAMYSFPNLIPLTNSKTEQVFAAIKSYDFDDIFGAFSGQDLYKGGRVVFENSLQRYRFAFRH
ncbi:MAG: hypothetical protein R2825_06025 [Saprospiraceae bacterium]